MAESSENPNDRLRQEGTPATAGNVELGRSIYARHADFSSVRRELGANVSNFIALLPLQSSIRGNPPWAAFPQARSSMDHLLLRWKMGKPGSGVVSRALAPSLPIAPEVTATESLEVKTARDAEWSAGAGFANGVSAVQRDHHGVDVASAIHARYSSSPGLISAGSERKAIGRSDDLSIPDLRRFRLQQPTESKLMFPITGSIMRKSALNNAVAAAARGPALDPADSLNHSVLSSLIHEPSASSSDLPRAADNSIMPITGASALSRIHQGGGEGLVLHRAGVQRSGVQQSPDAQPLASGLLEAAPSNSTVGGSAEPAPPSFHPAPEERVLSPTQGPAQTGAKARTTANHPSAPATEVQFSGPLERSLDSIGASLRAGGGLATTIMQPPILRRPPRSAAFPSSLQAKLESGAARTPEVAKTHLIQESTTSVGSSGNSYRHSTVAPQAAIKIQRKPGKDDLLWTASEPLLSPAAMISLPERVAAPISKLVQRRPQTLQTNAATDDFGLSVAKAHGFPQVPSVAQSGPSLNHMDPNPQGTATAGAGEHLVFRSTGECLSSSWFSGNRPSFSFPAVSQVSSVARNDSPRIAQSLPLLHRLSRRTAPEFAPSGFFIHVKQTGNFFPSPGITHRIQRVFAPDPILGGPLPGHGISSAEGMSRSLQRVSTNQAAGSARGISSIPPSLPALPENAGVALDITQVANQVYDLLVTRLKNERQRRGF